MAPECKDESEPLARGHQPTPEELAKAAREAKTQNPDFGVKRIWGLLKDKGWLVSEQRVKKVMQEIGLIESITNGADSIAKDSEYIKEKKNAVSGICYVYTFAGSVYI